MSRVLIAGCGYVGTALGSALAQTGHVAFGLRRRPAAESHGMRTVSADLSDTDSLGTLPPDLDYVFYTASSDERTDEAYRKAYVEGVNNLLVALERRRIEPKRFFLASSTGVYEQQNGEWVDESTPAEPTHFSGRRILEGEKILLNSPVPATVVRFGGIYGPGRSRLIQQLLAGRATYSAGKVRFTNRIHRDDCAGAFMHLMSLASPQNLYLAVDDEPTEQRELLNWLAQELDSPPPQPTPNRSGTRKGNKRCRNDRLRASGFRFQYANFREGYRDLLERSAGRPRHRGSSSA
jgi:nucleoside-diphosphate-sugar epimerase